MKTVDVCAWRKGKRIGIKVTVDGNTSELRYLKPKLAQKLLDKLRAGAKAKKYTLTERPRFVPTRISDALVFRGDSFVVMQQLEDCSVDTVICDPPYHLTATKKDGSRGKTGFMGKTWDGGDIAFRPSFWAEALRVTKPGGYLLAFSGSRTFHRMAVAIEDAGWQIKDTCIAYAYGCLSEDTEILVDGQWCHYSQATKGKETLCYDSEKDSYSWQSIQSLFIYDYSDTAFHITSNLTDQIVTRNHRCLVERDGGSLQFREAETLECEERVPVLEDVQGLLCDLSVQRQKAEDLHRDLLTEMSRCSLQKKDQISVSERSRPNGEKKARERPGYLLRSLHRDCLGEGQEGLEGQNNLLTSVSEHRYESSAHQAGKQKDWRKGSDLHSVQEASLEVQQSTASSKAPNLFTGMQRSTTRARLGEARLQRITRQNSSRPSAYAYQDDGREESCLEGRSDLPQQAWKLQTHQVCEMSSSIQADGEEGWLRDGASLASSEGFREISSSSRSGAPCQSRPTGQPTKESSALCGQPRPQAIRGQRYTKTDLAQVTEISYDGIVWCVQVPTGAFVARRNGKVFVTGNSGFPKSKNISADIDKLMGKKPTVVGQEETSFGYQEDRERKHTTRDITRATSKEAKKWEGYGSALKPSYEPIVVAMKALDGTYAHNALKHGVAGFNIDGARVKTGEALQSGGGKLWSAYISGTPGKESTGVNTKGRWPANLLFSHTPFCVCTGTRKVKSGDGKADYTPTGKQGAVAVTRNVKTGAHYGNEEVKTWKCHPSCLVAALDRQGEAMGAHGAGAEKPAEYSKGKVKGERRGGAGVFSGVGGSSRVGDNGGISRFYQTFEPEVPFFYTAKCSGKERTAWGKVKNMHPTLKPLSICRYLCKLTRTPTGGVVLDPFMGSGSMGIAALLEGRQYIGIELERASFKTAVARIKETPTYDAVAKREAKERKIRLDKVMKWTRTPKLFND